MPENETVNISLTKVTAKRPRTLSKGFRLRDGTLEKVGGGVMVAGTADKLHLSNIKELSAVLTGLNPSNALVYGITEHASAQVVTKKALAAFKPNGGPPVISRTREHFAWASGPGIFMNDGDFPTGTMDPDEYLETLYSQCSEMRDSTHLLAHSASSHIYNGDECLKDASGLRVLTAVKNAPDIPRAGKVLFKRLFIAGHGYIFITKSGAMLERTIVDSLVWQQERMDFCGGAHCTEPLEQRRPDPVVFNPDGPFLDTEKALPDLSAHEEKQYKDAVIQAKHEAWPEAKETQEKWADDRAETKLKTLEPDDPDAERERLKSVYTLAAKRKKLMGDFDITLEDGQTVEVLELLTNKDKYHGKRTLDPLEPDYDGGRLVGWLNLHALGRPYLFSHAHGGTKFSLHMARETMRLIDGERFDLVNKSMEALNAHGSIYIHCGELVTVSADGELFPRERNDIQLELDGVLKFERFDKRSNEWMPTDCKTTLAAGVMSAKNRWPFPKLKSVANAPILDPTTDRLLDVEGYDPDTKLILTLGDLRRFPGIPSAPTDVQVEDSVSRLWKPFELFPFDSRISVGVFFQTILTAAIRPLLPTAPGAAIDSPIAGSGKSKLCNSIAALAGEDAGLLPGVSDKEEIRKRILALLRQGARVVIFDNISLPLDSDALCVLFTGESYQDRILGETQNATVNTRALVLFSGNNLSIKGDLCRRILKCRIDPGSTKPWKRKFDFDPVDYCRENRLQMIADALTVIRAGIQRGPEMPDRTASFEIWSDTVRRSVLLVRDLDLLGVDDPVDAIDVTYDLDPETAKLSALMSAWWDVFGKTPVKVSDLIRKVTATQPEDFDFNDTKPELLDALLEIAGEGRNINSRRLGRWVERHRDRMVDELKIVEAGKYNGLRMWKIQSSF
jgi:hypothetical protein